MAVGKFDKRIERLRRGLGQGRPDRRTPGPMDGGCPVEPPDFRTSQAIGSH